MSIIRPFKAYRPKSSIVKEVAKYGGKVEDIVPPLIEDALKEKFKEQ